MKIDIVRIQRLSPKIDTHEILRLIPNTKTCQQGQGILYHGSGNAPSAVARGPHTRYVRISVDPSVNSSHTVQTCKPVVCARAQSKALRARRACHGRLTTAASPRLSPSHLRWALTSSANEARLAASLLACVSKTRRHSMDFLFPTHPPCSQ